jgi:hypothetical protein
METPIIVPSVLEISPKDSVNIENDLKSEQTKSIAQLLEEKDEKEDRRK